ncbi:MAG: hypothetical protein L0H54_01700 [Alcaligenaceae bacterium]|nr:hypothetical protein [Alcaligenaceae bacterium]
MRAFLCSLALCIGCAVNPAAADSAPWPAVPSRTVLQTPYGTLSVLSNEYIYESRLTFEGKLVEPRISGIINITYVYKIADSQAVLIAVSTGSKTCEITYYWIRIDSKGYQVSEPFGSCSSEIRVDTEGAQLVLSTPSIDGADKIDTWVYDGHTVRRR